MESTIRVGSVVKMVSLDPYGFNGRDYHPVASDIGCVGRVLRIDRFRDDSCWEVESADMGMDNDDPDESVCFTVAVGCNEVRLLELMDFEVEPLS